MGRSKVLNFGFSSSKLRTIKAPTTGFVVSSVEVVDSTGGISGTGVVRLGDKYLSVED
jgi:hypothetical protein